MKRRSLYSLLLPISLVAACNAVHAQTTPPVVNNQPPLVTVLATDASASEDGNDTGTFQITRAGNLDLPLTVFYGVGGTARNGRDYLPLPGWVTIAAGAASADVTVTPLLDFDSSAHTSDTVILQLRPLVDLVRALGHNYQLGWPSNAVVTISETTTPQTNRPPVVHWLAPAPNAKFVAPAAIQLAVDAHDPDGTVTNVEFFAGTTSLGSSTAPVHGVFSFNWTGVAAGDYTLTAKATDNGGATTTSDALTIHVLSEADFPVVTVVATDATASEDGPDPATFQILRSGSTTDPLTVFFSLGGSARNGVDYQKLPGSVTLPAGVTSSNITVVPILDIDSTHETNETVVLQLRSGVDFFMQGPGPYALGWPSNAVATIAESAHAPTNFPPVVQLLSPSDGAGFVAPANIHLAAEAHDRDGTVTDVEFFNGTTSLGVVTNKSMHSSRQTLFSLTWSNVAVGTYPITAVATDNDGASSTSGPVHIIVTQTALPTVSIFASDPIAYKGTNSNGGTNTGSFVVRRSGGTNADLTVSYTLSGTASNGVDYVSLPGTVTIPTGSYSTTVTLTPLWGPGSQTNHVLSAVLTLQASSSSPPAFLLGHNREAAALIVDRPGNNQASGRGEGWFHVVLPVASASAGISFGVEMSSDLINWQSIGHASAKEGAVEFVDPDTTTDDLRFYRAVPQTGSDDQ